MNLDQYNEAVKQIFTEQQSIAQQIGQQALAGAANPTNARFVELMTKQWSLIQRMSQLNSDMMLGIGTPQVKPKP